MGRRVLRIAALGAALALMGAAGPSSAAVSNERRARMATRYLVEQQMPDGSIPGFSAIGSTADAITSFEAAKRAPNAMVKALDYLSSHEGDVNTIGEKAKVILALVAVGGDPRDWENGRNLVQEIKDNEIDGRYGDSEFSYVFDQALSILALQAAGEKIPPEAITWLADAQCANGGWQFDHPSSPSDNNRCFDSSLPVDYNFADTNTTSLVIQALVAYGGADVSLPGRPWAFFKRARDHIKGGWVFAPQFACDAGQEPPDCSASDTNSTSLVIQAYVAHDDKPLPEGAGRALRGLQRKLCGKNAGAYASSWTYDDGELVKSPPDPGATIAAIPALMRKAFPIEEGFVTKPAPKAPEC